MSGISDSEHVSREEQNAHTGSPGSQFPAAASQGRLVPYVLIIMLTFFSHWFILTNDGTMTDSWYIFNFIKTRNWASLHDLFNSQSMPLFAWLFHPFAFVPDIVAGIMCSAFFSLTAAGILTYELAIKLGRLTRSEALALAVLTQAMPLFSAAQELIVLPFVFTYTLFLAAAHLAALSLELRGWRHGAIRLFAVSAFCASFTNAALLVFYGCFYVLLFFHYRRIHRSAAVAVMRAFVIRYPDFLLLPPVTWLLRNVLTPTYGWYENYNLPGSHLKSLFPNIWSFINNVLPYHVRQFVAWPVEHPLVAVLMIAGIVLCGKVAPKKWVVIRGAVSSWYLLGFGTVLLFLAVFPYAAAGKRFSPLPVAQESAHCILMGLPLAIIVLSLLRMLLLRRAASRWFPSVVACLAIMLASQLIPVYVAERAEWIGNRALLYNAARNYTVRNSSVILLQGCSLAKVTAYGTYGFASEFGELTRLVTPQPPENGQFYAPGEIGKLLDLTTFLPNDFNRINPSGQQIALVAKRNRGDATDRQMVFRYLTLRYFGTREELGSYLSSLVTFETYLLKPGIPLAVSSIRYAPGNPAPGVPDADFTNGAAMRMVRLPDGLWAAKFETTQAQYEQVMGSNPSLFKDPFRPVDSVSWHQAVEFCAKLTALEAKNGRLPGGFVYRLPTAREFDRFVADATPVNSVTSTYQLQWHTAPAGMLPPNKLGLHDVVGNVWEWCLDWGDVAQRTKIAKGGAWASHAAELFPFAGSRSNLGCIERAYIDRRVGPVRKDYPGQGFWDRGFRPVLAAAQAGI